jgi:hypothetical protein
MKDNGSGGSAENQDVDGKSAQPLQGIRLKPEDYTLALFDLTGEMMRFAITSIATTSLSLVSSLSNDESDASCGEPQPPALLLLRHLRDLRQTFESLDVTGAMGHFAQDVDKKMGVMKESVEKVEMGMYGVVVRGRERPEGWVMDIDDGREDADRY